MNYGSHHYTHSRALQRQQEYRQFDLRLWVKMDLRLLQIYKLALTRRSQRYRTGNVVRNSRIQHQPH